MFDVLGWEYSLLVEIIFLFSCMPILLGLTKLPL